MARSRSTTVLRGLCLVALLAGCQGPPEVRWHEPEHYPQRLSDWGVLARTGGGLVLGRGVEPYEIATPLFSDYALKLRTVYLPPGTAMEYRGRGAFELPVGSIVSKTFFYPVSDGVPQAAESWGGDPGTLHPSRYRLLETRLLVRQPDGWHALPYIWNGDDAHLRITGAILPTTLAVDDALIDLAYLVPARSECASCHATDHASGALSLIGLKAKHLNRPYPGRSNDQLTAWSAGGWLDGLPPQELVPPAADWHDPKATVEQRARAYLDANCGHCHSPTGPAATSGMHLDFHTDSYRALGVCKPPVAAGRGSGGHAHGIEPGRPDASILVHRMETNDPATRMPEIGRSIMHRAGVRLVSDWIAALPGECVPRQRRTL
jgi:uncharacterized repeat protein (TIGR03806 family)